MKWQKVSWIHGHLPKIFFGLCNSNRRQINGSKLWLNGDFFVRFFLLPRTFGGPRPGDFFILISQMQKVGGWPQLVEEKKNVSWLGNISLRDLFHSVISCPKKGVIKKKETRNLQEYLLFRNVRWYFITLIAQSGGLNFLWDKDWILCVLI